jgi:RHS repeat-associated protein
VVGLDYADQRFYASTYGRFNTPDPYKGGAKGASNPKNPGSWNRYSYVKGDPINRRDPNGTCDEPTATSVTVCDTFSLLDLQPVLSWPGDGYFSGSEVSSQVAGAINNAVGQAQAAALAGLITWELAQAVQLDEQVLDNNPLCDSVIGTGIGADGTVYSPSTVLQDIYSKTAFGVFVPTDILNGDNAQAIYPGNYTLFGYTGNVVQIDINDLPGSTFNPTAQTPIFGTAAITQAVTILHELGHAMNYLFGVGQIAPDGGNNPLSNANTQLIQQKCFPGVEGGAN